MHVFEQAHVFFHRGHPVRSVGGRVSVTDALSAVFDLSPSTSARILKKVVKHYPDVQDHLEAVCIRQGTPFMTADYMTFLFIMDRVRHPTHGYFEFMDHLFHLLVYRQQNVCINSNEACAFVEPMYPDPT